MKKFLFIIFALASSLSAKAQVPPKTSLISVGITSPEAASLGKFGNIPVGYSTGIPSISIPIYEIKFGDIRLPISLDYHSGGIRVDEASSSIGTGWALNSGGLVSRAMIGYPDELNGGYLSAPPLDQLYNNRNNYIDFIYDNTIGLNDVNPDVFSYNMGGETGKFIIKKSDLSFIQFPLSDNKIENYNGSSYKITDKNGLAYIFEQKETTTLGPVNQVQLIPTYTGAWRLTKIISSNLVDTVYLTYETVTNLYQHNKSYLHTIGTTATCSAPGSPSNSPSGYSTVDADTYVNQTVRTDESYLKQITWRGGQVSFVNIADRLDRAGAKRVSEIDVYSKMNGTLKLIKQAKLIHSNFYYSPPNFVVPQETGPEVLYRLRLDSVKFYDVTSAITPQVYTMTYNNTPMAPRESNGQDVWGFNNGHFENQTLMPTQTVLFNQVQIGNSYFTFGAANRDCDTAFIKACSIKSIQYPTGGKTVFGFEAHRYSTNTNQIISGSAECRVVGSVQSTNSISFTVTAPMSNLRYNAYISSYNYPDVSDRPRITVSDQATGQQVMVINNLNASQSLTTGLIPFNNTTSQVLQVGHTYTFTTNIYTANPNVNAYIDIYYETQTNIPLILSGGGLRVKTVTNYDNTGGLINQKSYDYNSDGTGTLLTPYNYLAITSQISTSRIGCYAQDGIGGGSCMYSVGKPTITYFANTTTPISQYTGSPVLYGGVTEYDVSSTNLKNNGKKVFYFPIYQDQQVLAYNDYTVVGLQMISNVWKNGYMSREDTYKSTGTSSYSLVNSNIHNYVFARQNSEQMVRIKPVYDQIIDQYSCQQRSANSLGGDVLMDSYSIPYSAVLLQSDTLKNIDDFGNQSVTKINYYYDDLTHILPTRRETFNSKGDNLTEVFKYPHDFAVAGNVYQTMLNRNMLSPVVRYQRLKNSSQLSLINVNYNDWFGNGKLLLPQTIDEQVLSAPIENRTKFNKYDAYGNILDQQKANAPALSYKWGYNGLFPVTSVSNAASNECYYEGFEENTAANVITGTAHTGLRFYNGAYTVTWTRPNSRSYVITYWYRDANGIWQYQPELAYAGNSYALTGGTAYDDIRIYPADAKVASYTYDPLSAITSSIDDKGLTTYYEYDGFQRLLNIKDQNGKILKNYSYNYKSTAAAWTDNNGRRCVIGTNGGNTGEQQRQETDTNPISPTYNQTRWVSNGTNTTACQLPTTVYIKQTVGSTSVSNGVTYNTLKFNTYSDANCTILVNAPAILTVNYTYVTSRSYADGRSPDSSTTNTTITIAAGSNQATSGSIIISGCSGIGDKQICYTPNTRITVQPGTGYTPWVPDN